MKENEFNPLDQYFRAALAQREEQPREAAWERVQAGLESPRNKVFAWWWLAVAALLFLSFLLPYLYQPAAGPALPVLAQPSLQKLSAPQPERYIAQEAPEPAMAQEVLALSPQKSQGNDSRPVLPLDGLEEIEEESELSPVQRQKAPRYTIAVKLRDPAPAKNPAPVSPLRRDSLLPALNESLWAYTEAQWGRLKEGESPQLPRWKKPQELRIPIF